MVLHSLRSSYTRCHEGDQFRDFEYQYNGIAWAIAWDPNKAIDIGEWSNCGGRWLERFRSGYVQSGGEINPEPQTSTAGRHVIKTP